MRRAMLVLAGSLILAPACGSDQPAQVEPPSDLMSTGCRQVAEGMALYRDENPYLANDRFKLASDVFSRTFLLPEIVDARRLRDTTDAVVRTIVTQRPAPERAAALAELRTAQAEVCAERYGLPS